jgi:thiamine kinase-like enzyme
VDGSRLWLIDFDLYCTGDPALDVGNFVGHLTEEALRTRGDAAALADCECAMQERFGTHAGFSALEAARVYALLTLARHVYLSTQIPHRHSLTIPLLDLCEDRIASFRLKTVCHGA